MATASWRASPVSKRHPVTTQRCLVRLWHDPRRLRRAEGSSGQPIDYHIDDSDRFICHFLDLRDDHLLEVEEPDRMRSRFSSKEEKRIYKAECWFGTTARVTRPIDLETFCRLLNWREHHPQHLRDTRNTPPPPELPLLEKKTSLCQSFPHGGANLNMCCNSMTFPVDFSVSYRLFSSLVELSQNPITKSLKFYLCKNVCLC